MAVRPDMIGIVTRGMAESLRFYRLLGLDVPEGAETEGHVEVVANGYRIAWDTLAIATSVYGELRDPVGHRIELAFKCDTREEVDQVYTKIVEAGFEGHREPWDAFWGQRYAIVVDPDGNLISLFAYVIGTMSWRPKEPSVGQIDPFSSNSTRKSLTAGYHQLAGSTKRAPSGGQEYSGSRASLHFWFHP